MTIVSFKHRFIFIKTAKTAGTSIEVDLSQRVEETAVVTPILPPVARHRARNYQTPEGEILYYNHMSAREIRDILSTDVFHGFTRFCVEREPVEKCISHFHMLRNSPLHNPEGAYQKNWPQYVAEGRFPLDHLRYSEMCAGTRVSLVTRFLRYDRLHKEIAALLEDHGISGFRLESKAKSEYSQERLISPTEVTPAERDQIYAAFRPSLDMCGIEWTR